MAPAWTPATISGSNSRVGESVGLTPAAARTSAGERARTGRGDRGSPGWPATHATASTRPASRAAHARDVTTPVHCAPGTAGVARA